MKKLAVILIFVLLPVVAALPTNMWPPLPENPRVGDTITREQTLSDSKLIHWGSGWTMLISYFYPSGKDIDTRYGGIWRHIETHEEGISFNVPFNRYINWSSENYTPIPFYLKSFEFSYSTNSLHSYNVTEGYTSEILSNATVSEEGLEDGVTVVFEMTTGMELLYSYCELITVINISITFVTTWEYWEWMCGGCIEEGEYFNQPVFQLALMIGVIFIGALIANRWDDKNLKSKTSELTREEQIQEQNQRDCEGLG